LTERLPLETSGLVAGESMAKEKSKVSVDKLLLDDVNNKYKLIISASRLIKEKTKKDGKTKVTPEMISNALYEVAIKETDKKEIARGKATTEESGGKKRPEEK